MTLVLFMLKSGGQIGDSGLITPENGNLKFMILKTWGLRIYYMETN
jgi:hypothetical protein